MVISPALNIDMPDQMKNTLPQSRHVSILNFNRKLKINVYTYKV